MKTILRFCLLLLATVSVIRGVGQSTIDSITPRSTQRGITTEVLIFCSGTSFTSNNVVRAYMETTIIILGSTGANRVYAHENEVLNDTTLRTLFNFDDYDQLGEFNVTIQADNQIINGEESIKFTLEDGGVAVPKILEVTRDTIYQGEDIDISLTSEFIDYHQATTYINMVNGSKYFVEHDYDVHVPNDVSFNFVASHDMPAGAYDLEIRYGNQYIAEEAVIVVQEALNDPVLLSMDPDSATQDDGIITVTIIGGHTHFGADSEVVAYLDANAANRINASNMQFPSQDTIIAEFEFSNLNLPASYDLTVRTKHDGILELQDAFELLPGEHQGQIVNVDPDTVYIGQELEITITGQDVDFLQSSQIITLSSGGVVEDYNTTAINESTLKFNLDVTPNLLPGQYDIFLDVLNGEGDIMLENGITVLNDPDMPYLVSIFPTSARQNTENFVMYLDTKNLHLTQKTSDLYLIGVGTGDIIKATSTNSVNDDRLEAYFNFSLDDPGYYELWYSSSDGDTLELYDKFDFQLNVSPNGQIVGIDPDSINYDQDIDITITLSEIDFTSGTEIFTLTNIQSGTEIVLQNGAVSNDQTKVNASYQLGAGEVFEPGIYNLDLFIPSFGAEYTLDSALVILGDAETKLIGITNDIISHDESSISIKIIGQNMAFLTNEVELAYFVQDTIQIDPGKLKVLHDDTLLFEFVLLPEHRIGAYDLRVSLLGIDNYWLYNVLHIEANDDYPFVDSPSDNEVVGASNETFTVPVNAYNLDISNIENATIYLDHYGEILEANAINQISDDEFEITFDVPEDLNFGEKVYDLIIVDDNFDSPYLSNDVTGIKGAVTIIGRLVPVFDIQENITVNVYPNPSKGIVSLSEKVEQAYVYNLLGTLQFSEKNTSKLHLGTLNPGSYLLHVLIDGRVELKQIYLE